MKTTLYVLILVLAAVCARAQTNDLTALLQQGLFEEQANRNLDAAIADYQALAAKFDQDRQLAATAVFRIGECYRMQGKTNEAKVQYERILREFPDQTALATLSRQNLTGVGGTFQERLQAILNNAAAKDSAAPSVSDEDREIQRLQQMIQNSPDLINGNGEELGRAANMGELRVAAFLLDHGADVNAKRGGDTPLELAAMNAQKSMVEFLLSRGADINARNGAGETALLTATRHGYQAVVELLLAHKADVNAHNSKQNGEETALHLAAEEGYANLIHSLLAAGADPNAKDANGKTPLNFAISAGSAQIVQALLGAGAAVNTEDAKGCTPLSFAAKAGNIMIVKLLLEAKADSNGGKLDAPIFSAIRYGNTNILELLLQAGANPNEPGAVGWQVRTRWAIYDRGGTLSPLRLAVLENKLEAVRLLLRFKADPNANDGFEHGQPVIFDALPNLDISKALLDAGADPNRPDAHFANSSAIQVGSPLMCVVDADFYSTAEDKLAVARLLIAHGANPDFKDRSGKTALHYAVDTGNLELVKLLLDNKADPNVEDQDGSTPLMHAKAWQNNNVVSFGRATLQTATGAEIAAVLRQYGALDNLSHWDRIEVSRPSANIEKTIFRKGSIDWNQFTLLELVAVQYQFLASSPRGGTQRRDRADLLAMNSPGADALAFPDLSHVHIHRPGADSKKWQDETVDLKSMLQSGDCSKDVSLQWGDVVEIPETDHPINDQWHGFSNTELSSLFKCLTGQVQLIIQGQSTNTISLTPHIDSLGYVLTEMPFWIRPVIFKSNLLHSSSDLSRVEVSRRDPATGKRIEWTVDCSDPNKVPDLWLRDGDIIEVPEKP